MNTSELTKAFKALSNPNRFRLFEEIRDAGRTSFSEGFGCVLNHVVARLSIGAPTVSHHLKELVNAGLVETKKQGRFVHCRVNDDLLATLSAYFADTSTDDPKESP